MAEHVASNWKTKARFQMTCSCGAVWHLAFKPTAGSGSQRNDQVQCDACRKISLVTVFGNGAVSGEGVKQKTRKDKVGR